MKLIKCLTNAPTAIALAFLVTGAPAVLLPSSGEAMAAAQTCGPMQVNDYDCDGIPNGLDRCPNDPANTCPSALDEWKSCMAAGDVGGPWWQMSLCASGGSLVGGAIGVGISMTGIGALVGTVIGAGAGMATYAACMCIFNTWG